MMIEYNNDATNIKSRFNTSIMQSPKRIDTDEVDYFLNRFSASIVIFSCKQMMLLIANIEEKIVRSDKMSNGLII